jgi:leucine-rich repeat protein SHOC2
MNRQQKDLLLMDDDEIFAEAQRRIRECIAKKRKKLDFSILGLNEIPPEIVEAKTLEELDLTGISLKKIPAFIGNIVSLKKLLLGYHRSSAHKLEEVVLPELGSLHNLKYLSLGYDILEIPDWVWTLNNLEVLKIHNDLIETIPAKISLLKKLRKLRVYGEKISSLPAETGELPLTGLDLQCPRLTVLPESFANLKKMEGFRFESCNMTSIPKFICGWTELEELVIGMENTFQGPYSNLKKIPQNIGSLRNLKYFSISGGSITSIPSSLGDCPLEYIEILGDFKTVPETFGKLVKLTTLKLGTNKYLNLPVSFGNLCALKKLDIIAPALVIPASFGKLAALERLSIDTENDLLLPKSFGGLSSLKELFIHAEIMRTIPSSIGSCKNLKLVMLTSDKLSSLPQSFCELKKLEELHLDTFALKSLPAEFGNLCALKYLDIFSGAITALPESIYGLKNLKTFNLSAYNIKKLPGFFNKLSYIKNLYVQIGREENQISCHDKKQKKAPCFNDFIDMDFRYFFKLLETYSLKEIETVLCSAPNYRALSREELKGVFNHTMLIRMHKLNRKFKWTEENKKRVVEVSDKFLEAWEDGFAKAKLMLETLYKKEKDKDSFHENYTAEIVLHPEILFDDDEKYEKVYDTITGYLNADFELSFQIRLKQSANSLIIDEDHFKEYIGINRDLSWNIEGFGDIDLQDHYICYALHILYSHNHWAFKDILKINNIITEVKISCGN